MVVASTEKSEESEVARHVARAAARLFAIHGYDATAVRTIVEEAGVTKPTLYYHFGSKEGLAQALLTVPLTELLNTVKAILDGGGEPVGMLERVVEAHLAFCREEPDRARFYYALCFGPTSSSELAAEFRRLSGELSAALTEAVNRLARAGIVAPERVEDCTKACRGLITVSTIEFLYKGSELGPGLARRHVGDLLGGFRIQTSTGREMGK
jgi:AcrR family transcriptional regulator